MLALLAAFATVAAAQELTGGAPLPGAAPELALLALDANVPGGKAPPRLELSTTSLPRFEPSDGATRLNMILLPPRQPSLGLALGLTNMQGGGMMRVPGAAGTAVDLGFHWRYTLDGQYRIDVTGWRRMTPGDAATLAQTQQPGYGARLEMQMKSLPSRGLVAERGFLGLQLESGARITVRRSGGRPMFYYRTKF
ncbi:hypothetical protein [Ramlibacter sp.]|uniref:hypothetical protein n=1 Tax=Ramlibacter sp. TaxID=1917967 RepID=UPI002B9FD02A|nr:hypothetical protein [Ramlibacter sp.]HWI80548.1 hypothetical protein [Ramlibacter sp.]